MASQFYLQIVERGSGRVHAWAPGKLAEVELVQNLCDRVREKGAGVTHAEFEQRFCERVRAKGVGVLRSEEHVMTDIRETLHEMIREFEAPEEIVVRQVRTAFQELLHDLKRLV